MVRPVFQWAFDMLLTEMESPDERAAHNLYRRIQRTTDAADFRKRLWAAISQILPLGLNANSISHTFTCRPHSIFIIKFSPHVSHETLGPLQAFGE
jgi:hypothetical protein